jgi:ubiquitin-conjugating enzyme E2 J1
MFIFCLRRQPSWSVRTALLALIAFMPTKSYRAIGSLDFSDAERRKLAKNSRTWCCETCGPIIDLLKHPEESSSNVNECESGSTSRVGDHSKCDEHSDRKSLSSDSDVESRDSPTDSQGSSTSTNGSESDGGINQSHQQQTAIKESKNEEDRSLNHPTSTSQQIDRDDLPETLPANPSEQHLTHDGRRSYPPLVFISISVLLFLLILRRVVMIVQA